MVAECAVCGLVWGLLGDSLDVPALVACALGKAGLSWPPGSWMWGLRVVSRSRQPPRASPAWFKLEVEEACAGSGGPLPTLSGRTLIGPAEVPGPPVDQSRCRKDWRAVGVGRKKQGELVLEADG